jgi:hypothetical protein
MSILNDRNTTTLSEYGNILAGVEHKGRRCIVRDDEKIRAGLYFVINLNRPLEKLPSGFTIYSEALMGRSFMPGTFEFKWPNERKNSRQKFTAE